MWLQKLGGDRAWVFLCKMMGGGGGWACQGGKGCSHLLNQEGGEMLCGMCGALHYVSRGVFRIALNIMKIMD